MRSMGKGKSMSDVEKEIDALQRKLTAKTLRDRAARGGGAESRRYKCNETTAYARLQNYRRETDREMAACGR